MPKQSTLVPAIETSKKNDGNLKFGTSSKVGILVRNRSMLTKKLGGGFKYFLFSPLFGEGYQFD